MTKFYFIRHGEPDGTELGTKIYQGRGHHMMTLTEHGKEQIHLAAKDERLKEAELILSSPYGRALHTSAILSKELGLEIEVETDLHEWMADLEHYTYLTLEEARVRYAELHENNGNHPEGKHCSWESADHLRERVMAVLEKYKDYHCVIVSCHGTLMQYFLGIEHPDHGQIAEYQL